MLRSVTRRATLYRLRPEWPKAHHDLGVVYLRNDIVDEAIGAIRNSDSKQRFGSNPITARPTCRFDNVKRAHPDRVKGTHPLVSGL